MAMPVDFIHPEPVCNDLVLGNLIIPKASSLELPTGARSVFRWPGRMALQPALEPDSMRPGFSAATIRRRNAFFPLRDASLTVSLSQDR